MMIRGETMKRYLFLLPLAALGACAEGEAVEPRDPCVQISAIMAARAEDEPFTSLRGETRMLGDEPLPDAWESNETLLDSACRLGAMRGFFGGNTDIFTYSCTLFEAGTMNQESDGELARAAYEEAVSTAEACLGDAWTTQAVSENAQYEVYGKTTFRPVVPEEQVGDFKADPLYVEMMFSRFTGGRGGKSGWEVTLQAQQQTRAN
tara:strand:+ start:7190 stop:7807 length:618 start_codon:yes stop_codon:yes gene_type:complete